MKIINIIFNFLWVILGFTLILISAFVDDIPTFGDLVLRVVGIFFIGCVAYVNIRREE